MITSSIVCEEIGNLRYALVDARQLSNRLGDTENIVQLLYTTTGPPESWADQGGPGSAVAVLDGLFLVRQEREQPAIRFQA